MQEKIRHYIFDLMSSFPIFGDGAIERYRQFTESQQDEETSYSIECRKGEMQPGKLVADSEQPYGYTEIIIMDDAYPGESNFTFELNTVDGGPKEELFFLEVSAEPDDDGLYLCQIRHPYDEEDEELSEELSDFFRIREFGELSRLLGEFESGLGS